jgi:hypothetical protein
MHSSWAFLHLLEPLPPKQSSETLLQSIDSLWHDSKKFFEHNVETKEHISETLLHTPREQSDLDAMQSWSAVWQ